MGVKFFVDANLGVDLVIGLRCFGRTNIEHISENFEEGVIDEEWLKYVGEKGYAVITKDKKIRKHPKEKILFLKYNIVVFYLGGSQAGIIEIGKQLINAWDQMEALTKRQQKKGIAGAFIIRLGGRTIKEINQT